MSGVMTMSVCWRSFAASARASPVTQGKNQFKPVPSKIALYAVIGLLPVIRTTRPPIRKARAVAASGVMMPPRRVENHSVTTSPVDVRGS